MLNCSIRTLVPQKFDSIVIIKSATKLPHSKKKSLSATAAKAFNIFQPQRDAEDSSLMPD